MDITTARRARVDEQWLTATNKCADGMTPSDATSVCTTALSQPVLPGKQQPQGADEATSKVPRACPGNAKLCTTNQSTSGVTSGALNVLSVTSTGAAPFAPSDRWAQLCSLVLVLTCVGCLLSSITAAVSNASAQQTMLLPWRSIKVNNQKLTWCLHVGHNTSRHTSCSR